MESQIERREEENRYFKNSLYLVQWLQGETRNQEVLSLNTWLLDGQLFKLENLLIGTSAERQKINGERPIRMVFYNNVICLDDICLRLLFLHSSSFSRDVTQNTCANFII